MTFNLDFLKVQRNYEYTVIKQLLPPKARILEIGAGTGYQAKQFADDGFDVAAVDLPTSNYADQRVFNVLDYDGRHIPFPDADFDVVFSSSVLEHVTDLATLHAEIKRVLRPGGIVLHVLPSASWRIWTLISGYVIGAQESWALLCDIRAQKPIDWAAVKERWRFLLKDYWLPARHGEIGNAFSEIWTFSRPYWLRHFRRAGFVIKRELPAGLFYSGNMLLGNRLTVERRHQLSKIFGSACRIYILTPARI